MFYTLVTLSGYSCLYAMEFPERKDIENIVNVVNSKTTKLAVYGSVLLSSNFFWNAVTDVMASIISPFTSVAFYTTNPPTAVLVPLVLNPFIDYVIKPLPNSLIHKNWSNEGAWLQRIYASISLIKVPLKQKFSSSLSSNTEENSSYPKTQVQIKQSSLVGLFLRLKYRVTNNPIASTIIFLQMLFTCYGMISSIKAKTLDNRTKVFVAFCSLYSIITHFHEFTNINIVLGRK